jgi:SAM-dependent methyltransferase
MPDPRTRKPTKAELKDNRWRASRNPAEVALGSRLIGDLVIATYERQLRAHAFGVLADIGCGKARCFGIYRDHVVQSVGVDWDSSIHKSDQVEVRCDLNLGIAFPDGFAGTVFCTDVLEHVFNIAWLRHEIAHILKPGGKAIIGVPFLYWIHEAPHDFHRYTSFGLRRYAGNVGLEVEALEAVGGAVHVLADITCKLARPCILQSLTDHAWRSVLSLRRQKTSSDTQFPLHYVLVAIKP